MATHAAGTNYTLLDLARQMHNGQFLPVAEVLAQENPILQDAPWTEANDIHGHKISRRTSLPSGTWRKINEGIGKTKTNAKPLMEAIGNLEALSDVDADLIDINPNPVLFRSQQDIGFLEGLSQQIATATIYSDTTTAPEQFDGFASRVTALSQTNAKGEVICLGGGGTGNDTTSIWLASWGLGKMYMTYPRGSSIGIQRKDEGILWVKDSGGTNEFRAYRTHWKWMGGLVVENDRCLIRYANIETAGSSNTFNDDTLLTLLNRLAPGNQVIYCNKTIKTQMDILAKDKSNVSYTSGEVFGQPVTMFRGVPVKAIDAIVNTETAIS